MKSVMPCLGGLIIYWCLSACHPASQNADIPPSCPVTNPLQELPWLKAIVADTVATKNQNVYIYQASYKGRITYRVDIIPGPDAGTITLYNCQGSVIAKGYESFIGLQTDNKAVFDEMQLGPLLYNR